MYLLKVLKKPHSDPYTHIIYTLIDSNISYLGTKQLHICKNVYETYIYM